jgi:hypothetical protein
MRDADAILGKLRAGSPERDAVGLTRHGEPEYRRMVALGMSLVA